jgi:glycosyltransferase involved in cell wall biosynthesis
MLRDGIEGALVAPGKPEALAAAIIPILRDPALRAAMGRAARLRAEQEFSLQGQVSRLASLYDEVSTSGWLP